MLKIGIESAIIYVASLISFLIGIYALNWMRTAMVFCALFFIAASLILALKIKSRAKTRIG